MSGHSVRLGVLVPPGNPTVEREMTRMAPPGVSFHFVRLDASGATSNAGSVDGMAERNLQYLAGAERVARAFAATPPAAILLAHTASSYATGFSQEPRLVERLSTAAGCPAYTAAGAIAAALAHLGIRRLALGTPYPEAISVQGRDYWQASGLEIVRHRLLQGVTNIYEETEARAAELARDADAPSAQGVLLSGTGLPTIGVLSALEVELGKPVLSSNQASLWRLLEAVGVRDRVSGFGRLLEDRAPARSR